MVNQNSFSCETLGRRSLFGYIAINEDEYSIFNLNLKSNKIERNDMIHSHVYNRDVELTKYFTLFIKHLQLIYVIRV